MRSGGRWPKTSASGDITTNLCVPAEAQATGIMVARESLTLAGVELLPLIFDGCSV